MIAVAAAGERKNNKNNDGNRSRNRGNEVEESR